MMKGDKNIILKPLVKSLRIVCCCFGLEKKKEIPLDW